MVGLTEVEDAARSIAGRVHRTPLLTSRTVGDRTGTTFHLKAEALQKTGSFKVRGALNKVRQLSVAEKEAGVVTVSAGNHAQALAFACAAEGVDCTVVMPETASKSKVEASRAYGARVVLHGTVFAAFEKCEELRAERSLTFVHPYDDEHIVAGQGTVGLEIMADLAEVDVVLVPVGGGGLLAGVATAVKALRPQTRVIGVEPVGAASLTQALRAGSPVRLSQVDTVADGLSAPVAGELGLECAQRRVDDVALVTDDEITDALALLLERAKLLVEPAGAAATAALLAGKVMTRPGETVVAIASGGNIDGARLQELLRPVVHHASSS